jgi:ATP-binding cassette subfamily B protein
MSDETQFDGDSIARFLGSVEMLSALDDEELQTLAEAAERRTYGMGETVCRAGDTADGLYLIHSGTVRLFSTENDKERSQGLRSEGDVFAEVAALREHKLEVSVRASSKCEVLVLPADAIRRVLTANEAAAGFVSTYTAIRAAGGIVTRLFEFKGKVDSSELASLVRSVGAKRVPAGAHVLEQDSDDSRLYVVRQGTIKIQRTEDGADYPLGIARQGDLFGEESALTGAKQPYSAIAETDSVVLVVPQKTVGALLEVNPSVNKTLQDRSETHRRELERQKQVAATRGRRVLLDVWSKPRTGEKVLRRFPWIEQAEEADCGAACLAMICKHFGIGLTLGKLRDMANVTTEGATLASLSRVGESLGFATRGVQCTFDSLLGFELPFVAHWEGYHFIVVYGISKNHVWVADPARGYSKMTVADFEKGWSGSVLLFSPGTNMAQIAATASPWVRFAGYLTPFKNIIGYVLLATLVVELLGVVPPVMVQNILDRVVVQSSESLLNVLIVGLIITQVFSNLTTLMRDQLTNYLTRNLDFNMISQFFRHTLLLPLSFFQTRRTGDIFARFQENQTVRSFLTQSTISTLLNVIMVFVFFVVLFLYSVKLTAVLLLMLVPIVVLTFAMTPRMKSYARESFYASTDAEAVLMETIGGAETVKGMGIERAMRLRWERKYAKSLDVGYRAQRFEIHVGFVSQLMNAAITVVVLWLGASMVMANELSIGQLIAFNMLMGSALSPLMGLIGLWDEIQETAVAMERLGDVLDLEPEESPDDIGSRIVLPSVEGEIRADGVWFHYGDNDNAHVLQNVSFDIQPGQMIAIVGQSGSGKTTLAKLIAGFYPPTEGTIYVDGYDLGTVDKDYYRRQLGYVMQSNLLFSGTIAENIAAGVESPDFARVVEVAKLADAHGFVNALPLGYEQPLGERGVGLSGGQVQRICIARALYPDPRIVIFDEATSALDSQSESNILKNMQDVFKGRTAIVIAHRLSTIMNADKILVLYEGSIVEQGTHRELIDRQAMYHELVKRQIGN